MNKDIATLIGGFLTALLFSCLRLESHLNGLQKQVLMRLSYWYQRPLPFQ